MYIQIFWYSTWDARRNHGFNRNLNHLQNNNNAGEYKCCRWWRMDRRNGWIRSCTWKFCGYDLHRDMYQTLKNCTNCTRTFIGKLKIVLRKDQKHFKNRQSIKGMITKYDINDYTESLCNTNWLWNYSGFILMGGKPQSHLLHAILRRKIQNYMELSIEVYNVFSLTGKI